VNSDDSEHFEKLAEHKQGIDRGVQPHFLLRNPP
jgi:hypothetical protein